MSDPSSCSRSCGDAFPPGCNSSGPTAYTGELIWWAAEFGAWLLQIIIRTEKGFKVLPRRLEVERTFAWLGQYLRLSKDYDALSPQARP